MNFSKKNESVGLLEFCRNESKPYRLEILKKQLQNNVDGVVRFLRFCSRVPVYQSIPLGDADAAALEFIIDDAVQIGSFRADISKRNVTTLPYVVEAWSQIRILDLSDTPIRNLPNDFVTFLRSLEELSILRCPITSLPVALGTLPNLRIINVSAADNPTLTFPPLSVINTRLPLQNNVDGVVRFLRESAIGKPSNIIKALVVGFESRGKSTLFRNHAAGSYDTTKLMLSWLSSETTITGDRLRLPLGGGEIDCLMLNLAGQMEYYVSHSMFVTNTLSVYVVVYRLDERTHKDHWNLDYVGYWLSLLHEQLTKQRALRSARVVIVVTYKYVIMPDPVKMRDAMNQAKEIAEIWQRAGLNVMVIGAKPSLFTDTRSMGDTDAVTARLVTICREMLAPAENKNVPGTDAELIKRIRAMQERGEFRNNEIWTFEEALDAFKDIYGGDAVRLWDGLVRARSCGEVVTVTQTSGRWIFFDVMWLGKTMAEVQGQNNVHQEDASVWSLQDVKRWFNRAAFITHLGTRVSGGQDRRLVLFEYLREME